MLPWVRKNLSRSPFADRSTCSAAPAPLNTIVSRPYAPSIRSLPSPGSQTNVSSPAPSTAVSLPPLPSIVSFPYPPISVSAPEPPAIVSSPPPPSIVVEMSAMGPLPSSIRTRSSPARVFTTIAATSARATAASAEPSSPKSTSRVPGTPACRRSARLSAPRVPETNRTPCTSLA